jgi:hypothetical protein
MLFPITDLSILTDLKTEVLTNLTPVVLEKLELLQPSR